MFYVIGSEDQSRVLLHTAPANRTKGVVEQFGIFVAYRCCVGLLRLHYYGSNIFIRLLCSDEPLWHYYTSNVLCRQGSNTSHYIQNFKRKISTDTEKFLYLLGHLMKKNQRAKNNSVQPGQNFQNSLPTKLVGSLKPHFCPSWTEVEKPTSTQLVSKSKITLPQIAAKLWKQLLHRLGRS